MPESEQEKSRVDRAREERTEATLLPIFLRSKNRRAVVVGGGTVGTRKAASLVEAGFRVNVVSPEVTPELAAMAAAGAVEWDAVAWPIGAEWVPNADLLFACTNDRGINESVADAAHAEGVLINIADDPEGSDFLSPAVVRMPEEKLLVAISTGGRAPSEARKLREELAAVLRGKKE